MRTFRYVQHGKSFWTWRDVVDVGGATGNYKDADVEDVEGVEKVEKVRRLRRLRKRRL